MNLRIMLMGVLVVVLSGSAVFAGTADVVIIVDESGSMGGEHAWLDGMISSLDSALSTAGVTGSKYALVGFGAGTSSGGPGPGPRTLTDFGTVSNFQTANNNLLLNGGIEDGYAGIDWALDNLTWRSGAARNVILITDEDRDNWNSNSLTFSSTESDLEAAKAILNVVVNAKYKETGTDNFLIGVDAGGTGYKADGSGGYTTVNSATFYTDWYNTQGDYIDLAWQANAGTVTDPLYGAYWDLNQLRAGGNTATSFTKAFVDLKVSEIETQITQLVPLPASAWLGLGLLGGLGIIRRIRRRKAA